MSSFEETDKPLIQGDLASRQASAVELLNQYGSIGSIPLEQLVAIGYVRNSEDQLMPTEIFQEVSSKAAYLNMAEKAANRPFEPFTVELEGKKTNRFVTEDTLARLLETEAQTVATLEYLENGNVKILNDQWQGSYENIVKRSGIDSGSIGPLYLTQLCLGTIEFPVPKVELLRIWDELDKELTAVEHNLDQIGGAEENDEDEAVRAQLTNQSFVDGVSSLAERNRGRLTDRDVLNNQMDEKLGSNELLAKFVKEMDDDRSVFRNMCKSDQEYVLERENLIQYIQELADSGILTIKQYTLYVLEGYINNVAGLTGDSSFSFNYENSPLELLARTITIKDSVLAQAKQNLKLAKQSLKGLKPGTEARTQAETNITNAKSSLRQVSKDFEPLIQLFGRPQTVANYLNKQLDEMQAMLYGGSDSSDVSFTFDASVSTEFDADPGVISGDCTAGNPLPFNSPANNLYNVKVFQSNEHIGNIYLLVIKNKQGKPLIWHLDAIQIPKYLDWQAAAPSIIKAFHDQADQKGVKFVTINGETHHISNYSYIQEAFKQHSRPVDENTRLFTAIKRAAKKTTRRGTSNGQENQPSQLQSVDQTFYRRLVVNNPKDIQ